MAARLTLSPHPYGTASRDAQILNRDTCTDDYVYYKVPAPWVQVKILRLVQMYPPPSMSSPI